MMPVLKGPACLLAAALFTCDPALTKLFTPAHPQLGRYDVCTTAARLEAVLADNGPDGPHFGPIEALEPLDAFGTGGAAGTYRRSALTRVYGSQRPRVARGWLQQGQRFESLTLISPYPDASLTRLHAGTMVIRLVIDLRVFSESTP